MSGKKDWLAVRADSLLFPVESLLANLVLLMSNFSLKITGGGTNSSSPSPGLLGLFGALGLGIGVLGLGTGAAEMLSPESLLPS